MGTTALPPLPAPVSIALCATRPRAVRASRAFVVAAERFADGFAKPGAYGLFSESCSALRRVASDVFPVLGAAVSLLPGGPLKARSR